MKASRKYLKSMRYSEKAIIQALLYSDVFDFPLTKAELWRYFLGAQAISPSDFEKALTQVKSQLVEKNDYYCLPGREEVITRRKTQQKEVAKKVKRAIDAAQKLSYIPSILFIGVSGSLAVGNVTKKDDIDLFIIVKKNTLFVTRLWILLLLTVLGLRRKRTSQHVADKVCVNLLIDTHSLHWTADKQNVYVAHEIAQIHPLFDRSGMYEKFLFANRWITEYLPNSLESLPNVSGRSWQRDQKFLQKVSALFELSLFALISKKIQISLIRRHQTIETVAAHVLAFHPNDYGPAVLQRFKEKNQNSGLLTKK